jgi:ferredoxin
MAKYFVDEALCQAHGQCFVAAPDLFFGDADGYNRDAGKGWQDLPPHLVEQARAAAAVCPETAIFVPDDA